MKAYKKELLIPQTTVAGNIRDFKQSYEIFYYPKTDDLPDKIALYIHLINSEEKQYAKRSLYFSSIEQLKTLIYDLSQAYFYFRDKRIEPDINLPDFRLINLDNFLYNLRKKILNIWTKINR